MLSTTKPVVVSFSGNNYIKSKYYYYRVVANEQTIYFGKVFCSSIDNVPTIQLDLRRILQANAYDSQYSLKPVFDAARQIYTPSFSYRKRFANTDIMQTYQILIESDLEGTVVAQYSLLVTSAYDLLYDMPAPASIPAFIQPLAYRTNLIPRYPNAVTDKYGIYFFTEHKAATGTIWLYLLDQPVWSIYRYQLTTPSNVDSSTHQGNRNTLPFNITMEYFFTHITPAFTGTQTEQTIINAGNSATNFPVLINAGNSTTNFTTIIDGGNAASSGQSQVYRPFTGDLYISSYGASLADPVKVAHIDTCNSKYYLAWMTHSGAPFSWGFDGNTVKKSNVERTVISNYSNFDSVAAIEQRYEFELRSGIVDKETYDLFADIIDSPYLYLYSVEEDKSWYCILQDNDFAWKKVKSERQPLNLTLNLKECSSINK